MTDEEIITAAEAFFTRVTPTCEKLHKAYSDDIEFGLIGNQWDPVTTKDRVGRLTLTVNRIRQFIYQVVNEYKKQEMTSKVLPHDTTEYDKKMAEVRRGIMRSLERKKGGLQAYNNAAKTLIAGGLGGWQINTRYVDPMSFDQEPYFIPIEDMASVLVDFDECRELDMSDMRECVVYETYGDKVRFEKETGANADEFFAGGNRNAVWGTRSGPRVSNYWFKEEDPETLVSLSPVAAQFIPELRGRKPKKSAYLSDLKKWAKGAKDERGNPVDLPLDILIANDPKTGKQITRPTTRCKVRCAKIGAKRIIGEILEWPVDEIPVILVIGRKTSNAGKIVIEGLTRQSRDAQRSYNYMKSNKTERIAQVPKNPFFVPEGGIPAAERSKWNTMNTRLHPYLTYAVFDGQKRPIPPPHRSDPIQADPGLIEEERASVEEIKATTGMDDPSLGHLGKDRSGVALKQLDANASTTNYDFTESMILGIKRSTRILSKLIPKVFDTERQVSMVGEDDREEVIMVNSTNPQNGQESYTMDDTEYDTDVEAGPSSATKGEQIRDDLTAIFSAVPGTVLPLGSDYVRNSEMRNADDAADRFERWANTQSPGLYEDKKQGQPNPQMIAQMQAQMQQMQQQMQEVGPQMQKLQADNHKLQVDSDNKAAQLEIDRFNADTNRMLAQAKIQDASTNMLLAADKQQHDKTIENAQAVHAIQRDNIDATHEQRMAHVDAALNISNAVHTQTMDRENLAQSQQQHEDNLGLKVDAQKQAAKAPKEKKE